MPYGKCRLCEAEANLQLSHILPSFVFRWLRESGGGSPLRNSREPNQRTQDGEKEYWLCQTCEGLLSRSERTFSNKLFHPYFSDPTRRFSYGPWLLHFCTSVSWRALLYFMEKTAHRDSPLGQDANVRAAEAVWREYLLGSRQHPMHFRQYIYPLDQIATARGELAPNINRYLMRAIDMDLCGSTSSTFVYSKLGRFIILGFISQSNADRWRGGKVHAKEGVVESRRYVMPSAFGSYLNSRAKKMDEALASVSDRQYQKMEEGLKANAHNYVTSDAFVAMQADVEMFGDDAFLVRNPRTDTKK
ncbi:MULTISPECIES: hypothetical protein [Paraburkholderia]|uniref:hypothetical protein n=1 Tax=Paraburkholderia TaxID=1822464 RepID=UPI002AB5F2F8|nr:MULTISPECIES: hypothetical protein [Paraburkholderia]